MASRFYLDNTAAAAITPGFAAWSRTADADRKRMHTTKDASAMASRTFTTITAANNTGLIRQYISDPLAGGIAFVTSDTFTCVIRAMESAINDNINRQPICVKVISEDGATLRATLFGLAHAGPNTTEWGTTLQSELLSSATGTALTAGYTTVNGDRLCIEVGGQISSAGGTTVTGTMSFGSDSATDLSTTEHVATANNPWFEISRTISWKVLQAVAGQTRGEARTGVKVAVAVRGAGSGMGRAVCRVLAVGAVLASARGEARARTSNMYGARSGPIVASARGEARASWLKAPAARLSGIAVETISKGTGATQSRVSGLALEALSKGTAAPQAKLTAVAIETLWGIPLVRSTVRGEARTVVSVNGGFTPGPVAGGTRGEGRATVRVLGVGAVVARARGEARAVSRAAGPGVLRPTARGEARAIAGAGSPRFGSATLRGEGRAVVRVAGVGRVATTGRGEGRAKALLTAPGAVKAAARGEARLTGRIGSTAGFNGTGRGEGRAVVRVTGVGAIHTDARGEARAVGRIGSPLYTSSTLRGEARASVRTYGEGAVQAAVRGEARGQAYVEGFRVVPASGRGEARATVLVTGIGQLVASGRGEARADYGRQRFVAASHQSQARGVAMVGVGSPPFGAQAGGQTRAQVRVTGQGAVRASAGGIGRLESHFIPIPIATSAGSARAVVQLLQLGAVVGNEVSIPIPEMLMIERIELHRIKDIDPITGLEIPVDVWEQHWYVESQDQAGRTNPAFLLRDREVRLLNYQTDWDGWYDQITLRGVRSPLDDEDFWTGLLTPNELLGPLFCTCLKLECARLLSLHAGEFDKAMLFLLERLTVERDLVAQGAAHNRTLSIRGAGFPHQPGSP